MFEARPYLYDITLKDYSNRDVKKKAMEEIASTFGLTGEVNQIGVENLSVFQCFSFQIVLYPVDNIAKKWKNIRTIYS